MTFKRRAEDVEVRMLSEVDVDIHSQALRQHLHPPRTLAARRKGRGQCPDVLAWRWVPLHEHAIIDIDTLQYSGHCEVRGSTALEHGVLFDYIMGILLMSLVSSSLVVTADLAQHDDFHDDPRSGSRSVAFSSTGHRLQLSEQMPPRCLPSRDPP